MKVNPNTLIICGAILIGVGVFSNALLQLALAVSVAEASGMGSFSFNANYSVSSVSIVFGLLLIIVGFILGFTNRKQIREY